MSINTNVRTLNIVVCLKKLTNISSRRKMTRNIHQNMEINQTQVIKMGSTIMNWEVYQVIEALNEKKKVITR